MPIKRFHGWSLLASLPLVFVVAPSTAEEGWGGTIGVGGIYAPDYLGSDDYESSAWPAVSLTYGERFYLNALGGLGWHAIIRENWKVSPFISYNRGRDNDHDLNRLDEVDGGATAGLRVAYTNGAWTYSGDTQTPFSGDMDGYQVSLKARWQGRLGKQWFASLSPSLTYSSAVWTNDMFGISLRESARSSLPFYDPDEGHLHVGLGVSLSYQLTSDWSITGLASVSQLTGGAKDSPIVNDIGDATQASVGASLNYRF